MIVNHFFLSLKVEKRLLCWISVRIDYICKNSKWRGKGLHMKTLLDPPSLWLRGAEDFQITQPHDPFLVTRSSQKSEILGENKDMLPHMKKKHLSQLIYYMCCCSVHGYPADHCISEVMKCALHINKTYKLPTSS